VKEAEVMPQSNSGHDRHRPGWQPILAISASLAIATSIALTGAGSSFALWNSSVVVSAGSLNSGTVAITQQGFEAMGTDFSPGDLSVTSPVTVTNTGLASFDLSASVDLAAGSSPGLAAAVSVIVWEIGSIAECTALSAPVLARTGTWSAAPAFSGRLASGAAQLFCFRSILDPRALDTQPGATVTAELTVTAKVGGWSAVAVAAATQRTPSLPGIGCTQQGTTAVLDWLNTAGVNYGLYVNGVEAAKTKKAMSPYLFSVDDLAAAGIVSPGEVIVEVRQLGQGAVLFARTITLVLVGTQLEVRC
jgi:hypothetical protein